MFVYEKKLQYPVKIANPNPKLAAAIISQYGGPDGELGASLRYLSQCAGLFGALQPPVRPRWGRLLTRLYSIFFQSNFARVGKRLSILFLRQKKSIGRMAATTRMSR